MNSSVVSVFGSAKPAPGTPAFAEAEAVGRLLAELGCTVMTGGYGGVMAGASKGAKEAGGHVIGVTVTRWEQEGMRHGPNPYIDNLIAYPTLAERLNHLVVRCDAAVALTGGIGTLSEVCLAWSYLQSQEMPPKPLMCLGAWWGDWLAVSYGEGGFIRAEDKALLQIAVDHDQLATMLKTWKQRLEA